jgi:hypothetical protein
MLNNNVNTLNNLCCFVHMARYMACKKDKRNPNSTIIPIIKFVEFCFVSIQVLFLVILVRSEY